MTRQVFLVLLFLGILTLSPVPGPNAAELPPLQFEIPVSGTSDRFWTAPPTRRVFLDDPIPAETGDRVSAYAARNEFEPVQIVIQPAANRNLAVSAAGFGADVSIKIARVEYVPVTQVSDSLGRTGPFPDPLWPLANGETVSLNAGENTAFWITFHVAPAAAPGDRDGTVTIGGTAIPVRLHIFDFALPRSPSVRSQMNVSFERILNAYGVSGTGTEYWDTVDRIKTFFLNHRLTPKNPLWPGGLATGGGGPFIDYDCATRTLSDPYGIWGFDHPADKYLNGNGFNDGVGFPSFMAATFRTNDASDDQRPISFCNIARTAADWRETPADSPYNAAWFNYISDFRDKLAARGYLDRSYIYLANEPGNQADYDAVAWMARNYKAAAPDLRLMVSEEPRPEIYDNAAFGPAEIDIWLPVLHNFDPAESADREIHHGEETWIYFLRTTRPPYFNPITLDHPGIEARLTGWFLWKYRLRGIAYYSINDWSPNPWADPMTDGHNGETFLIYPPDRNNQPIAYGSNGHRMVPSIRMALLREGLEDYEYLRLLAGGQPNPDAANAADPHADKIINGLASYNRDDDFLHHLRREIGRYLSGETSAIPDLQPPVRHPRAEGPPGNYYLNFQDPTGRPADTPLVVDGNTFQKIGWAEYDTGAGYGWFGDMANVMYEYRPEGPNPLQRSILYDNWGREKTFEFDLPPGTYEVTVSVGWPGKDYDRHRIFVEGVSFVDDEGTSSENPYLVRTREVPIPDGKLTMEMGIFDEFTMLNYLTAEAVGGTGSAGGAVSVAGELDCQPGVGIGDAVEALRISAGLPRISSACPFEPADLDGDGRIGPADAVALLQAAAEVRTLP